MFPLLSFTTKKLMKKCSAGYGAIPVRIGSVSGIAGRGDTSLIHPVPDAETLPYQIQVRKNPETTEICHSKSSDL